MTIATVFQMNNDADRGWVWKYEGQLNTDGAMSIKQLPVN